MDLKRMRQLLESGKYKRMADLHADFNLMMQNCATFNRDNRYFYNYGQRIKRIGSIVIKSAEEAETKLNQVTFNISLILDSHEEYGRSYNVLQLFSRFFQR
jgi:hypothetical protein